MFYLIDEDRKCYRLKDNVVMKIGRVQCDITLRCRLMGRLHATITVQDDEVFVEDLRTVNGTTIDGKKLEANCPTKLDVGSTLCFASNTTLKLKKLDFIVTSLGLNRKDIGSLREQLNSIDIDYEPKLTSKCTFIVCTRIEFSLEFVSALKQKVRFVKPAYFADVSDALDNNKSIPDAFDYFPEISAQFPKTVERNFFDFNTKRNVLFADKTFVCETADSDLAQFLESAAGTVITDCAFDVGSDSVFMVCKDGNIGKNLRKNLIPTTENNIMLAILFVDCRFLTASSHANTSTNAVSANSRSLLHAVENERFSEDVFSAEVTQTKRKRREIGEFFTKKQCNSLVSECSSSSSTQTNRKTSNEPCTNDLLMGCYPDISIVKWILPEDN